MLSFSDSQTGEGEWPFIWRLFQHFNDNFITFDNRTLIILLQTQLFIINFLKLFSCKPIVIVNLIEPVVEHLGRTHFILCW